MKKTPIAAALSLALLAAACSDRPSGTADENVIRADTYLSEGKPRDALIALKNALTIDPRHAHARQRMAALMLAVGDGVAAEVEARKALDLGYDPVEGQILLARAYLRQGKYAGAREALGALDGKKLAPAQASARLAIQGRASLGERDIDGAGAAAEQALALVPGSAEALDVKVRVLYARGDRQGALTLARTAAQANPTYGPLWQQLGDIARADGDPSAALEAYTHAIANQFDNRDALTGRSLAYIALGDYDKARSDVGLIRGGNPRDSFAAFLDGFILLKEGQPKEAKGALELSVGGSPDAVDAVYLLGIALLQLNDIEQAQTRFEHVVALAPEHIQGQLLLGYTRMERGNYDGATASARAVLARDPANTMALELASKAALRQGAGQVARPYVEKLLAADPQAARYHLAMGLSLLAEGQTPAGLAAIEQARRLEPGRVDNDVALIRGLIAQKEYDRAVVVATELEAKLPGQTLPFILQGMAHGAAKRRDEARAAFDRAWAIEPGDPGVARALAALAQADGNRAAAVAYLKQGAAHPRAPGVLHIELAQLLLADGDAAGFESEARRALALAPADTHSRVLLMRFLMNTQRAAEATRLADEAPARSRQEALFQETAGVVLLSAGRPRDALPLLEALAKQRPTQAEPLIYEGLALASVGMSEQAHKALEKAVKLEPKNPQALTALAEMEIRAGRKAAAEPLITRLAEVDPKSGNADRLRIQLNLQSGDLAQAIATQHRALERDRTTPNAVTLIQLYRNAGRVADAESAARAWLADQPADGAVAIQLAEILDGAGRRPDAVAAYRQFLERKPNDVAVLNNLATLLAAGDRAEALAVAERAYALAPNLAPVVDTYAWILHLNGRSEQAEGLLAKAYSAAPRNATIAYHYAVVAAQRGNVASASEALANLPATGFPEAADAGKLREQLRAKAAEEGAAAAAR